MPIFSDLYFVALMVAEFLVVDKILVRAKLTARSSTGKNAGEDRR